MDWFRMYGEFASDPKVQSMSEAMQRRLMMLLCLRCSNTLVTLQDDEIAFALRITDEELADTKTLFLRKGFIDESWEIANWDKRQFVSDSSAPRVAAYRERQKLAKEQSGNVTVTPQIQNRTDTEQKQNIEEKPAPQAAVRKPSRKSREIPLPDGFCISDAVRSWAAANDVQNLDRHFSSFVTKATAKGYTYVDWDAAFRNAVTDDWAKLAPVRAGPDKPAKFDPLAHVNRNRTTQNERTITFDEHGQPV